MSVRKRLLFAIVFTIAALATTARFSVYKAESDLSKANTWLRASMPAAAEMPWHGSQPANEPWRLRTAFRRKGELLPSLFVPIQFKNPKELAVGKLLVASRGLGDPHFAETVVLLVHYDENGVLGLVLNRRTDVPLSRVLDLEAAKDRSDPVYLGGPVVPSAVFALFQSSAKIAKAENIFDGVYLIAEKGLFEQILSAGPDPSVFSRLHRIYRMDKRSIADRGAIGCVVRFSGRHRLSIQFRPGFFVAADDSEDRVAVRED